MTCIVWEIKDYFDLGTERVDLIRSNKHISRNVLMAPTNR
jgi:hypothetical protein